MKIKVVILSILISTVFSSAIAVVYAAHVQRKLFIDLQKLQNSKNKMMIEWDKLLLEENTLSSMISIENKASKSLDMMVPESKQIIYIRLPEL
jgi:cell division protein FtsL